MTIIRMGTMNLSIRASWRKWSKFTFKRFVTIFKNKGPGLAGYFELILKGKGGAGNDCGGKVTRDGDRITGSPRSSGFILAVCTNREFTFSFWTGYGV